MEEYKIPQEHQSLPQEHQSLPPEHTLPEEFSAAKPVQAEKKKSTSRRWMAMIAATFMTMQLMFTYFVPPTDPSKQDPPIYTEPGLGGPPDFNVGDFNIHAMPSRVDDTWLREGLQRAGEYFEDLDYIRAAVTMQNALFEFRMDYNTYDLDHVGYAFHNSTLVDFDGYAVNGFYFYFEIVTAWLENKIGEMEPVEMLDAYIVSFAQGSDDTYYRVLHVTDELSEYMLYGMSYDWEATFTYTEGTLDDAGNSARMTRTMFDGNNISANPNVDGMYEVYCYERLEGPVGGYAFLNETRFQNFLNYNDAIRDFELDEFGEQSTIYMQVLTEDGCVDLDHPAVLDATGGMGETTWDDFRADTALDLLAGENFVSMKAQINRDHEVQISNIDYADPLLPLDMTVALSVQSVVEQVGGIPTPIPPNDAPDIDDGNGNENQNGNGLDEIIHGEHYQDLVAGIMECANYFMADDYIRAAAYFAQCLAHHSSDYGAVFGTEQVFEEIYGLSCYCDGSSITDASTKGLPGCYFDFELDTYWWVGNSETKTYFNVMKVTITRAEETAEGTCYRVVQFAVGAGRNNVAVGTGQLVTDHGDGLRYIEGVFDEQGKSENCQITVFRNSLRGTEMNLDGKISIEGVRRLQGIVQNGAFVNGTVLYDSIAYDASTHTLNAVSENGERIISINFLTADGRVDFSNPAVVDNRTAGTDFDAYENDPALRCLAGNGLLELKYDVKSAYYSDLQIHDLDYGKPLFPLDMTAPFSHQ